MTALEQQSTSPWLIRFRSRNTAQVHIRLFCFHYAGASASIFRSWDEAMPDGIEVVAVQFPGREYRLDEPLLTDAHAIAGLVTEILPLDKRFVFFGHSMGVFIGFEVADSCVNKGFASLKCSSLRGGTHRNSSGGMPGCNCFPMMSLLRQ